MCCRPGCSNRGKRGRPQAPPEQHAETRLASGVVGTASRARSGAEQRARTTAFDTLAAAQIGTSGVLAAASTPAVGWLGPRREPVLWATLTRIRWEIGATSCSWSSWW